MSVTRFLTLVSVLAAAPAVAAGQSAPPIPAAKVDAVFKDFGPTTPGCALGVYRNGAVAYAKGYGMADLSLGVPISPRTMFDIGSTSKQFAAAAVALLALDGKLQLSDDVRKYVPELPSYGAPITIDHMLRHTSGLRDYNGLLYLAGHRFEDFTDDDDALAVIVAQRNLNFAPGSRWDYSNTGFFLLSTIVKRVSGLTLAQFARERIFSPLGMTRTHFRDDHTEIVKDRATAYSPGAKGGYVIDMSNWDQTGDGAVNTNVLELARWDANFANPRVGGRDFVTMLETRGQLNNGDTLQYARGLFVDRYRGLRRVHHGGAWAGYRAMLMRFPDQGVSIAVTCNVADGDPQGRSERVADAILAGRFTEPKGPTAPAAKGTTAAAEPTVDPAGYVGTYFSEKIQNTFEIVARAGGIAVSVFGGAFDLVPRDGERFTAKGVPVDVTFGADRRTATIAIRGQAADEYVRVQPPSLTAADLEQLVGSYPSPELKTTWTVTIDSGKAVLRGRAFGRATLEPVVRDGFRSSSGFATFTRGADGRITGFDFSASRMQRIRFDRSPTP